MVAGAVVRKSDKRSVRWYLGSCHYIMQDGKEAVRYGYVMHNKDRHGFLPSGEILLDEEKVVRLKRTQIFLRKLGKEPQQKAVLYMSQKQKLIDRLNSHPKDFTYEEARTLLGYLGFIEDSKGKTSGSRMMFVNKLHNETFRLHKPHPQNILKNYQIMELAELINRQEALQ